MRGNKPAAARRTQREPTGVSSSERSKARRLAPRLIAWFSGNARDLPWRRTHDPYAIWVSEIMLQQTQVKTVIPYYERWMQRLPDIHSLSRASSQRLHKLWEGLGYYTRVRNMQSAAKRICGAHNGQFPHEFEAVMALPGIGRYTAGAICSIAFNQPTPILDGNVVRVLTRVFGVESDPKETRTNAHLWQLATALVTIADRLDRQSSIADRRCAFTPCSALNQSLMELGATLCTPRNPDCPTCPIRRSCVARRDGMVQDLPALKSRPNTIQRRVQAFVIHNRGRCLVMQRPEGTVNGGLWEFPSLEVDGKAARPASQVAGIAISDPERLGTVRHVITRYRITVDVYRSRLTRGTRTGNPVGRWITVADLKRLPFSAAHRRIAETLLTGILTRQEQRL